MKLIKGDRPGWEALFSDDELHRFTLHRPVPTPEQLHMLSIRRIDRPLVVTGRHLVSCGLNPSKADAFRNDNTVSKEIVHAWLWWCERYTKVNAYAWRETKPKIMWQASRAGRDIIGSDPAGNPPCGNDEAIRSALAMVLRDGGIALAAWGNHVKRDRSRQLHLIAEELGVQWWCLGTNNDGSPKHSLYRPYCARLEPWRFR